jgi:hypothetical protein
MAESARELSPRPRVDAVIPKADGSFHDGGQGISGSGAFPQGADGAPAATSEQLRQVLRRGFDGWLEPLSESPADLGVPPERSGNLAIVVIAALEGAIILARIRRDLTPFDALVLELGPLLDAVTRPAARGTSL